MFINEFSFNTKDLVKLKSLKVDKVEKEFIVNRCSHIDKPKSNSIVFMSYKDVRRQTLDRLYDIEESIIITYHDVDIKNIDEKNNIIIRADSPKVPYANILTHILYSKRPKYRLCENNYYIGENVSIGKNTYIEPGAFIDSDVTVGCDSIIRSGARIRSNTLIGNNTIIRENSVIGGEGFETYREEAANTIRVPHVGGVIIEDNVEIGALNTIAAGLINPTVIKNNVKTDDHVHIAHCCSIGESVFITACAEISGSVKIGERAWIAPNCAIINNITIGKESKIGIGSVVTKDISDYAVAIGNPSKVISYICECKNKLEKVKEKYVCSICNKQYYLNEKKIMEKTL